MVDLFVSQSCFKIPTTWRRSRLCIVQLLKAHTKKMWRRKGLNPGLFCSGGRITHANGTFMSSKNETKCIPFILTCNSLGVGWGGGLFYLKEFHVLCGFIGSEIKCDSCICSVNFPEKYQIGSCMRPGSVQMNASLCNAGGPEAIWNVSSFHLPKELYKYQLAGPQCMPSRRCLILYNIKNAYTKVSAIGYCCLRNIICNSPQLARCTQMASRSSRSISFAFGTLCHCHFSLSSSEVWWPSAT